MSSSRSRTPDRGQALGLVIISIAFVAVIAAAMTSVAVRMAHRGQAQNAADAAALAGVDGGGEAAAGAARRNGGALVSFHADLGELGVSVTVEVEVGGEHAIAEASSEP